MTDLVIAPNFETAMTLPFKRGPIDGPLFTGVNDNRAAPGALSKEVAEATWVR